MDIVSRSDRSGLGNIGHGAFFMRYALSLALGTCVLPSAAIAQDAAAAAEIRMVRIELQARASAFQGAAFGTGGVYEELLGIAHMRIDPRAAANRGIVDLDRAPRDRDGMVDYDVDLKILRPKLATKASRVMVFDVVNRGNSLTARMTGDASHGVDADFLMRRGYTLVTAGWQGDVVNPKLFGARLPVARGDAGPIAGRIATTAVFDDDKTNRIALPYPTADGDQDTARLMVRERAGDPDRPIPATQWRYDGDRGVIVARPADVDAGAIYTFSYVARDPVVMGLGFAAVRDLLSFLRHGDAAAGNPVADIAVTTCPQRTGKMCDAGAFDATVGVGLSQSARYLRDFIWQGFNRDLNGGRVFDGVVEIVPGARRTFTNFRFAEPSRFTRQHEDHGVPGSDFPFTYATVRDPVTGRSDGILSRCTADDTCPKVFHIDTSSEFWQASASLVGTGGTGKDVAFPPNVRAYLVTGGSHAPKTTVPQCELAANPLDYTPITRALLIAMIDWTTGRQAPPASRWPLLAKGELVAIDTLHPPAVIGVTWPKVLNRPDALDGTSSWPLLVPKVDGDGIDIAGIHLPEVAAPQGTYLGWNVRREGFAAGDLCFVYGGYVPFAATAAARKGDPRSSLAERYPGNTRNAKMRQVTQALRKERLLLDERADGRARRGTTTAAAVTVRTDDRPR